MFFFDKKHILISRGYQLHLASAIRDCSSDNTDAYSQKEEEEELQKKPKKSCYSDLFHVELVTHINIRTHSVLY
jgi:hypothetical protein